MSALHVFNTLHHVLHCSTWNSFEPWLQQPWTLVSTEICREILPPLNNYNTSDTLSLVENLKSYTKKSLCFTALEPCKVFCFASSIAALLNTSLNNSCIIELWTCRILWAQAAQHCFLLHRPSTLSSIDIDESQWQQTVRETFFSNHLTNLTPA